MGVKMYENVLPEFERFLGLLRVQTPRAQGMFQYALVLLMIDDESARIIGTRLEVSQLTL